MEHFVVTVALIGVVVIVASLLSGAMEKSGVPLVALFLLFGALLGPWGLELVDVNFDSPSLRTLSTLALALVLFSDAVSVDTRELRTRKWLVWRLLGPGTLVPASILATVAHYLLGMNWPASAILGAALASTDPIILRSAMRSPSLSPITRMALRLETGMNDVVLLPVVVVALLIIQLQGGSGEEALGRELLRHGLGLFLLGPALGALVGWLGIVVLIRVRSGIGVRRDYESLYALGLAFTGYAAAEAVGGSGFLAAFAAGLLVSAQDVELCDCFLEYGEATAEMLLLLTFVALGTSLIWTSFEIVTLRSIAFTVIALCIRTVVLYPLLTGTGVGREDRKLIALLGPRGLSTLLLALLPIFSGMQGAELVFQTASLVVICSILLHGAGIAHVLRTRRVAGLTRTGERALPVTGQYPVGNLEQNAGGPVPAAQSVQGHAGGAAAAADSVAEAAAVPERISLDEFLAMRAAGDHVVIVDSRAQRSFSSEPVTAEGAVRVAPDDPVRDATELRLSQRATLVVYCA